MTLSLPFKPSSPRASSPLPLKFKSERLSLLKKAGISLKRPGTKGASLWAYTPTGVNYFSSPQEMIQHFQKQGQIQALSTPPSQSQPSPTLSPSGSSPEASPVNPSTGSPQAPSKKPKIFTQSPSSLQSPTTSPQSPGQPQNQYFHGVAGVSHPTPSAPPYTPLGGSFQPKEGQTLPDGSVSPEEHERNLKQGHNQVSFHSGEEVLSHLAGKGHLQRYDPRYTVPSTRNTPFVGPTQGTPPPQASRIGTKSLSTPQDLLDHLVKTGQIKEASSPAGIPSSQVTQGAKGTASVFSQMNGQGQKKYYYPSETPTKGVTQGKGFVGTYQEKENGPVTPYGTHHDILSHLADQGHLQRESVTPPQSTHPKARSVWNPQTKQLEEHPLEGTTGSVSAATGLSLPIAAPREPARTRLGAPEATKRDDTLPSTYKPKTKEGIRALLKPRRPFVPRSEQERSESVPRVVPSHIPADVKEIDKQLTALQGEEGSTALLSPQQIQKRKDLEKQRDALLKPVTEYSPDADDERTPSDRVRFGDEGAAELAKQTDPTIRSSIRRKVEADKEETARVNERDAPLPKDRRLKIRGRLIRESGKLFARYNADLKGRSKNPSQHRDLPDPFKQQESGPVDYQSPARPRPFVQTDINHPQGSLVDRLRAARQKEKVRSLTPALPEDPSTVGTPRDKSEEEVPTPSGKHYPYSLAPATPPPLDDPRSQFRAKGARSTDVEEGGDQHNIEWTAGDELSDHNPLSVGEGNPYIPGDFSTEDAWDPRNNIEEGESPEEREERGLDSRKGYQGTRKQARNNPQQRWNPLTGQMENLEKWVPLKEGDKVRGRDLRKNPQTGEIEVRALLAPRLTSPQTTRIHQTRDPQTGEILSSRAEVANKQDVPGTSPSATSRTGTVKIEESHISPAQERPQYPLERDDHPEGNEDRMNNKHIRDLRNRSDTARRQTFKESDPDHLEEGEWGPESPIRRGHPYYMDPDGPELYRVPNHLVEEVYGKGAVQRHGPSYQDEEGYRAIYGHAAFEAAHKNKEDAYKSYWKEHNPKTDVREQAQIEQLISPEEEKQEEYERFTSIPDRATRDQFLDQSRHWNSSQYRQSLLHTLAEQKLGEAKERENYLTEKKSRLSDRSPSNPNNVIQYSGTGIKRLDDLLAQKKALYESMSPDELRSHIKERESRGQFGHVSDEEFKNLGITVHEAAEAADRGVITQPARVAEGGEKLKIGSTQWKPNKGDIITPARTGALNRQGGRDQGPSEEKTLLHSPSDLPRKLRNIVRSPIAVERGERYVPEMQAMSKKHDLISGGGPAFLTHRVQRQIQQQTRRELDEKILQKKLGYIPGPLEDFSKMNPASGEGVEHPTFFNARPSYGKKRADSPLSTRFVPQGSSPAQKEYAKTPEGMAAKRAELTGTTPADLAKKKEALDLQTVEGVKNIPVGNDLHEFLSGLTPDQHKMALEQMSPEQKTYALGRAKETFEALRKRTTPIKGLPEQLSSDTRESQTKIEGYLRDHGDTPRNREIAQGLHGIHPGEHAQAAGELDNFLEKNSYHPLFGQREDTPDLPSVGKFAHQFDDAGMPLDMPKGARFRDWPHARFSPSSRDLISELGEHVARTKAAREALGAAGEKYSQLHQDSQGERPTLPWQEVAENARQGLALHEAQEMHREADYKLAHYDTHTYGPEGRARTAQSSLGKRGVTRAIARAGGQLSRKRAQDLASLEQKNVSPQAKANTQEAIEGQYKQAISTLHEKHQEALHTLSGESYEQTPPTEEERKALVQSGKHPHQQYIDSLTQRINAEHQENLQDPEIWWKVHHGDFTPLPKDRRVILAGIHEDTKKKLSKVAKEQALYQSDPSAFTVDYKRHLADLAAASNQKFRGAVSGQDFKHILPRRREARGTGFQGKGKRRAIPEGLIQRDPKSLDIPMTSITQAREMSRLQNSVSPSERARLTPSSHFASSFNQTERPEEKPWRHYTERVAKSAREGAHDSLDHAVRDYYGKASLLSSLSPEEKNSDQGHTLHQQVEKAKRRAEQAHRYFSQTHTDFYKHSGNEDPDRSYMEMFRAKRAHALRAANVLLAQHRHDIQSPYEQDYLQKRQDRSQSIKDTYLNSKKTAADREVQRQAQQELDTSLPWNPPIKTGVGGTASALAEAKTALSGHRFFDMAVGKISRSKKKAPPKSEKGAKDHGLGLNSREGEALGISEETITPEQRKKMGKDALAELDGTTYGQTKRAEAHADQSLARLYTQTEKLPGKGKVLSGETKGVLGQEKEARLANLRDAHAQASKAVQDFRDSYQAHLNAGNPKNEEWEEKKRLHQTALDRASFHLADAQRGQSHRLATDIFKEKSRNALSGTGEPVNESDLVPREHSGDLAQNEEAHQHKQDLEDVHKAIEGWAAPPGSGEDTLGEDFKGPSHGRLSKKDYATLQQRGSGPGGQEKYLELRRRVMASMKDDLTDSERGTLQREEDPTHWISARKKLLSVSGDHLSPEENQAFSQEHHDPGPFPSSGSSQARQRWLAQRDQETAHQEAHQKLLSHLEESGDDDILSPEEKDTLERHGIHQPPSPPRETRVRLGNTDLEHEMTRSDSRPDDDDAYDFQELTPEQIESKSEPVKSYLQAERHYRNLGQHIAGEMGTEKGQEHDTLAHTLYSGTPQAETARKKAELEFPLSKERVIKYDKLFPEEERPKVHPSDAWKDPSFASGSQQGDRILPAHTGLYKQQHPLLSTATQKSITPLTPEQGKRVRELRSQLSDPNLKEGTPDKFTELQQELEALSPEKRTVSTSSLHPDGHPWTHPENLTSQDYHDLADHYGSSYEATLRNPSGVVPVGGPHRTKSGFIGAWDPSNIWHGPSLEDMRDSLTHKTGVEYPDAHERMGRAYRDNFLLKDRGALARLKELDGKTLAGPSYVTEPLSELSNISRAQSSLLGQSKYFNSQEVDPRKMQSILDYIHDHRGGQSNQALDIHNRTFGFTAGSGDEPTLEEGEKRGDLKRLFLLHNKMRSGEIKPEMYQRVLDASSITNDEADSYRKTVHAARRQHFTGEMNDLEYQRHLSNLGLKRSDVRPLIQKVKTEQGTYISPVGPKKKKATETQTETLSPESPSPTTLFPLQGGNRVEHALKTAGAGPVHTPEYQSEQDRQGGEELSGLKGAAQYPNSSSYRTLGGRLQRQPGSPPRTVALTHPDVQGGTYQQQRARGHIDVHTVGAAEENHTFGDNPWLQAARDLGLRNKEITEGLGPEKSTRALRNYILQSPELMNRLHELHGQAVINHIPSTDPAALEKARDQGRLQDYLSNRKMRYDGAHLLSELGNISGEKDPAKRQALLERSHWFNKQEVPDQNDLHQRLAYADQSHTTQKAKETAESEPEYDDNGFELPANMQYHDQDNPPDTEEGDYDPADSFRDSVHEEEGEPAQSQGNYDEQKDVPIHYPLGTRERAAREKGDILKDYLNFHNPNHKPWSTPASGTLSSHKNVASEGFPDPQNKDKYLYPSVPPTYSPEQEKAMGSTVATKVGAGFSKTNIRGKYKSQWEDQGGEGKAPGDLFVGRGTPWGNNFEESHLSGVKLHADAGKDELEKRSRIIRLYRDKQFLQSPAMLEQAWGLRGRKLQCYCAPQNCHAQVLSEFANILDAPSEKRGDLISKSRWWNPKEVNSDHMKEALDYADRFKPPAGQLVKPLATLRRPEAETIRAHIPSSSSNSPLPPKIGTVPIQHSEERIDQAKRMIAQNPPQTVHPKTEERQPVIDSAIKRTIIQHLRDTQPSLAGENLRTSAQDIYKRYLKEGYSSLEKDVPSAHRKVLGHIQYAQAIDSPEERPTPKSVASDEAKRLLEEATAKQKASLEKYRQNRKNSGIRETLAEKKNETEEPTQKSLTLPPSSPEGTPHPDIPNVRHVKGDLLRSSAPVHVNTVNTGKSTDPPGKRRGAMGRGIALQFKQKYGDALMGPYQRSIDSGSLKVGHPQAHSIEKDGEKKIIVNFPTKHDLDKPSQEGWIRSGLQNLLPRLEKAGVKHVAFPKLGTGKKTGQLDKARVTQIMLEEMKKYPSIRFDIHDVDDEE